MARVGKIARLPREVRAQLNSRLDDGSEAEPILSWLNALPEVQSALARHYGGRPVTPQNISEWRNGGFQEWLARRDLLADADDLAADQQELQSATRGRSLADHLSNVIAFRLAAILSPSGADLDEKALVQLRALLPLSQAVVKMRRGDLEAARLQMETQRWELDRLEIQDQREEHLQQKQKVEESNKLMDKMNRDYFRRKIADPSTSRPMADYLRSFETAHWGDAPTAETAAPAAETGRSATTPPNSHPEPRPRRQRRPAPPAAPPEPAAVPANATPVPNIHPAQAPSQNGADEAMAFIETALELSQANDLARSALLPPPSLQPNPS
jgi:hypothetical protein